VPSQNLNHDVLLLQALGLHYSYSPEIEGPRLSQLPDGLSKLTRLAILDISENDFAQVWHWSCIMPCMLVRCLCIECLLMCWTQRTSRAAITDAPSFSGGPHLPVRPKCADRLMPGRSRY